MLEPKPWKTNCAKISRHQNGGQSVRSFHCLQGTQMPEKTRFPTSMPKPGISFPYNQTARHITGQQHAAPCTHSGRLMLKVKKHQVLRAWQDLTDLTAVRAWR